MLDHEMKKKPKNTGMKNVILDVFSTMNFKLKSETQIDVSLRSAFINSSGSTCNSVIYTPEKLIICNVGDSRTILGKFVNGSKFIPNRSVEELQFV